MQRAEVTDNRAQTGAAFGKQARHFDVDDLQNPLLQIMRSQVYDHVSRLLSQPSRILELNAGTGIDALHFIKQGHKVHATDLSEGMIEEIKRKVDRLHLQNDLTVQQLSYDQLDELAGQKFDLIFSNFGGLNCIDDLTRVTRHLPRILNAGGYVTWVIMPAVCFWEILGLLKGNRNALRRFNRGGAMAHLEGEHFRVWYHSLQSIKKAFGDDFKLVRHEGLAALAPSPHATNFPVRHPALYKLLRRADAIARNHYPFNRWADHLVISFQLVS